MNKRLNFQERLLKFIKKTKPHTLKHVSILLVVTVILLVIFGLTDDKSATTPKNLENKNNDLLSAVFMGDIMLGRHVEKVIERKGLSYIFHDVEENFKNADFVTANFEHPILENELNYEKQNKNIHLYSNPNVLSELKNINFSVLSLANNHAMDYNDEGLISTINYMSENNIAYVGAGKNRQDAESPHYTEVNGLNIATLGFSDAYVAGSVATPIKPGIASARPRRFIPQIGAASRNADITIVHVHWGEEYDTVPSKRQRDLAKAFAEAGADIIIGHHPHVLQPIELINDTVVFYSLGNFVFDQGWSTTRETAMIKLKVDKRGMGEFFIEPMLIKEASPRYIKGIESYYRYKINKRITKNSNIDFIKDNGILSFKHSLFRREAE